MLRIWVTVRPRARKEEVKESAEGEYVASVLAPPQEGKANQALVRLLAERFSLPRSSVRIIRGQASRRKLVEIDEK